ncbi:MAG TPA: hypothetical protein PKA06_15870, partial [Gemmatales bacterium]|nr:hypothetical protein [Gemmatales bacterium]
AHRLNFIWRCNHGTNRLFYPPCETHGTVISRVFVGLYHIPYDAYLVESQGFPACCLFHSFLEPAADSLA